MENKAIKLLQISKGGKKLIKELDFYILVDMYGKDVEVSIITKNDEVCTFYVKIKINERGRHRDGWVMFHETKSLEDIKRQNKIKEILFYMETRILKADFLSLCNKFSRDTFIIKTNDLLNGKKML